MCVWPSLSHVVERPDMIITYDPSKNLRNIVERGLPFDQAAEFEFSTAIFALDARHRYAEDRVRAIGKIRGRVHVLVYTYTADGIRVISLRKANAREVKSYESQTKS